MQWFGRGALLPGPVRRWWIGAAILLALILLVLLAVALVNPGAGTRSTDAPRAEAGGSGIAIPAPLPGKDPARPVAATWSAPADMPKAGAVVPLTGALEIPSSGGFAARPASLYLPPAALVRNAPPLPLVVFMMGQPGSPDPAPISAAMDALAATHHGLAPIVIIADQLGAPENNPACVDSTAFGGVERYFTHDIPDWARAHLRILHDAADWTIAGFSNGGGCALDWGVEHPKLWGNIVSLSGESYQGTEHPDDVLHEVFGGDVSAYEDAKPVARAAKNAGRFDGHVAVFTAGDQDEMFTEQSKLAARIARDAGFETYWLGLPGADHHAGLAAGLARAFPVLLPRLGLTID